MITEQPFLPLFFNSEDEDLWDKLQKLPVEKRSEISKQALREFFQAHPELIQAPSKDVRVEVNEWVKLDRTVEVDEVIKVDDCDDATDRIAGFAGIDEIDEIYEIDEENSVSENDGTENDLRDSPEQVEFSLESLFAMSTVEARTDPVQNLLSVIGEEEDEEVIRLLLRPDANQEE